MASEEHIRIQVSVEEWLTFLKENGRYKKNIRSVEDAKQYFVELKAKLKMIEGFTPKADQLNQINQYIIYPDVTVNNQFYVFKHEFKNTDNRLAGFPIYKDFYSLLKIRFFSEDLPSGVGEIHVFNKDTNFRPKETQIKMERYEPESKSGKAYSINQGFKTYSIDDLKTIIAGLSPNESFDKPIPVIDFGSSALGGTLPAGSFGSFAGASGFPTGGINSFSGISGSPFSKGGQGGGRRRRSRKAKKNKAHTPK